MRKIAIALAFLSVPALATEYGSPAELRGLHKIFVEAGDDVDLRNAITQVLGRAVPDLEFVDDEGLADFTYETAGDRESAVARVTRPTDGRRRLIWGGKQHRQFHRGLLGMTEDDPPAALAKTFADVYKRANK